MDIRHGFVGTVGNTPLIRLNSFSDETGCEILGKAEFLNPGGSVKDRAAHYIIQEAEERGALKPGGTVVEGTAGNTGIGLTHICNAKGYRCLIVIPETQSQEKIDMLRTLGAEVKTVPAVPYSDPNHYVKVSGRLAEQMDNAIWANQFDNTANRRLPYPPGPSTTGAPHGANPGPSWNSPRPEIGTFSHPPVHAPAVDCHIAQPSSCAARKPGPAAGGCSGHPVRRAWSDSR